MHLRDFELAGEKRCVPSRQLISHLDGEVNRAGVSDSFVFAERVTPAAIFNLPPTTCANLFRLAIKFPSGRAGGSELGIDLAATRDWSIYAQCQSRHPTKDLEIFFVRAERERSNLH